MKTTLLLATVAAAALAQDASPNYLQFNLGANVGGEVDLDVTTPPDTFSGEADLETGTFGSITGGLGMEGGWVLEGELLLMTSDIDTDAADAVLGAPLDAHVESYAAMVNGVYNFSAGGFRPYVGAGVGFGTAKYSLAGESEDDMGVAWQVKAGVVIPSTETLSWDIGYRYVSFPSFDIRDGADSFDADASAHIVSVGARITF